MTEWGRLNDEALAMSRAMVADPAVRPIPDLVDSYPDKATKLALLAAYWLGYSDGESEVAYERELEAEGRDG